MQKKAMKMKVKIKYKKETIENINKTKANFFKRLENQKKKKK